YAVTQVLCAAVGNEADEYLQFRRLFKALDQAVEQIDEKRLAVGDTHGLEYAGGWLEAIQLTIVRQCPMLPPQLIDEGMGIFQANIADIGLTDMANSGAGPNGLLAQQGCQRGIMARLLFTEPMQAIVKIENRSPTISMRPHSAPPAPQPGKAEAQVGGAA